MHYYQPHTSSKQWLNCPPSAKLCAEVDDRSSAYAQQGTDAHTLCEYKVLLATGKKATWDPTEHLTYYDAEMENCADNGLSYNDECYISHSDCIEDANAVKELVEEKFPALKGKVLINNIGAVIGSHTGNGTVALFFMGSKRVD